MLEPGGLISLMLEKVVRISKTVEQGPRWCSPRSTK